MARGKKKIKLADLPAQDDARAEVDWEALLAVAQPLLKKLDKDLVARAKNSLQVTAALKARHASEKQKKRTADSFVAWQEKLIAQVGAAWLLSCVFVRTLEDRGLLDTNRIAGPGAADSQRLFFELAPSLNERDYLLFTFRELSHFPAVAALFDNKNNPAWLLTPSAEMTKELLGLFRAPQIEAPAFRFGQSDTGFLGWLYQDLDEGVRANYALLQTPRFVESFILDRTLEPAIDKFGLDDTTIIDPTCGSGHFLLGAFDRLYDHRLRAEPGLSGRLAATKALDAVFGADINPYAVAIARFRLTLAYLEKGEFDRLKDAPALPLHLVVADSLLHNPHKTGQREMGDIVSADAAHKWKAHDLYELEDAETAREVLHRNYAVVVGNPPYITVKDAALREEYRDLYPRSAAGKYSIAAPFTERFFQLGRNGARVGMITANSFMKREFGKKLIKEYLPTTNLDLIVNTSGAYIPGHATPTVLLFGSSEPPVGGEVRTVLASRGEPSTPDDPSAGQVWSSIARHWDEVGFEDEYITVTNMERGDLEEHPWSLAGGGASELQSLLLEQASTNLADLTEAIGFASFTGLDDAFILPSHLVESGRLEPEVVRPMIVGEAVRDWRFAGGRVAITPYTQGDQSPVEMRASSNWGRLLWRCRTVANNVSSFGGKTRQEEGQNWWEWYRWQAGRYRARFRIAFAEVASHNHFVLDSGGAVFKQSAPIIVLPAAATEAEHHALLAYLNSSTACFLLKQTAHVKQMTAGDSVRISSLAKVPRQFSGGVVGGLPLPDNYATHKERLALYGKELTELGVAVQKLMPSNAVPLSSASVDEVEMARVDSTRERLGLQSRLVAVQEELDWFVYRMYGLVGEAEDGPSNVETGGRAFERAFGQRAGTTETIDGFAIATDPPDRRTAARLAAITSKKEIRVLEVPDFKRRWIGTQGKFNRRANTDEGEYAKAVADRVALALEGAMGAPTVLTAKAVESRLDAASTTLLAYLVTHPEGPGGANDMLRSWAVPFLAAYRYTTQGLERHKEWQAAWDVQRREDKEGSNLGAPVPPKFSSKDYRSAAYFGLRGKLDVPKERFISFPGCESDSDSAPVYGWAGWDHEQRAKALAGLYWNRKTEEGWGADRLTPMLAGLLELLPWLVQWHSEPSPDYGVSPAEYYEKFLDEECRLLSLTRDDLRAWRPPEKKRKKKTTKKAPKKKSAASKGDA